MGAISFWKRRQEMGWASLILGVSILLSRFLGLIRDKVISYYFGAVRESDLYFAAFVIPDFINYLLAGGYFSITLIPLLSESFNQDEEDGWNFFSAVFMWVVCAITAFTAVTIYFAPHLAHLTAPGMPEASLARLSRFLRIIMPAQVFFLAGSCFMALLYMRKQFIAPALAPIIYNFAIILGGVLMRDRGMEGFCWGVCVGAFAGNFLLQWYALSRSGGLRLRLVFTHPKLRRFFTLALPLMLGQSIVVLDEQLVRVFGSYSGPGAISWLNYARRIMLVPVGVVAQAAGVASYPFLAELMARKDYDRFHQTINSALRGVITLLAPLSLWMMAASEPIIRIIFQQGRFAAVDALETAALLRVFLLAVFFWGFQQMLGRAFYARQDTITPTVIGTLATAASLPIFWLFTHLWGSTGVALASTLSMALYALALAGWWRKRFGGAAFDGLGGFTFRMTLISLAACAPSLHLAWSQYSYGMANSYLAAWINFILSGASFVLLFAALSLRFAPSAVRPYWDRGMKTLARVVGRPAS